MFPKHNSYLEINEILDKIKLRTKYLNLSIVCFILSLIQKQKHINTNQIISSFMSTDELKLYEYDTLVLM